MSVVQIENGVVVCAWRDVATLAEHQAKYPDLVGDFMEADAIPGMELVDGAFVAPDSPVAPRHAGTWAEFMALFSIAERRAIKTEEMGDIDLALLFDELRAASTISLGDARIDAALADLVTAGALTQARKDEIISADFNALPAAS
ncbi:hypothetical protein [Tateyamaria sp. syn59]|uniref:hypothetical protein n=1 Tax=Tateyamaria sp. syn59 TaxID=2576942 RepID=UPI0011BF24BE|nr:hypothetical protein [Tateyamaria sp. syn59]